MNKQTRKALITDLMDSTYNTADEYVHAATEMVNLASQGRTDRWKSACTMAGRRILASSKPLTLTVCREYVSQGILAMEAANK